MITNLKHASLILLVSVFSLKAYGQLNFEMAIAPGVGEDILRFHEGYIVTGTDNSLLHLYRLNNMGDTLWDHAYGVTGMNGGTSPGDLEVTSDSAFLVAGAAWPSLSSHKMYILKTDSLGNFLWEKFIGQGSAEEINGLSIKETPDHFYIACGTRYDGADNDIYVVKLDSTGNVIWEYSYDFFQKDYAGSLVVENDNSYLLCGYTVDGATTDGILLNLDSAGNLNWNRPLGNSQTNFLRGMILTSDSNLLMCGYTVDSITQSYDVWLLKTDLQGDSIFSRQYGIGADREIAYSIAEDDQFSIYVAGSSQINIGALYLGFILKTDGSGNQQWFNYYGSSGESFRRIGFCREDSTIIATGYTMSFGGGSQVYVLKADLDGIVNITEENISEDLTMSLFPNPVHANISIQLKGNVPGPLNISIYNINGEKISNETTMCIADAEQIDLGKLSNGIYFVRMLSDQKGSDYQKIIIQH